MNTNKKKLSTVEILTKAKELLSKPKKWIKGILYSTIKSGDGSFCSIGAMRYVANIPFDTVMPNNHINKSSYRMARELLTSTISHKTNKKFIDIITFNDDKQTTKKQVLNMFDLAIKKAKRNEK